MIRYPKVFVSQVVSVFGEEALATRLVRNGEFELGTILAEKARSQIKPEFVIENIEENPNIIKEKAEKIIKIRKLHKIWLQFMTNEIIELQSKNDTELDSGIRQVENPEEIKKVIGV